MKGYRYWVPAIVVIEAIAAYSKGVELQPDDPPALNNLAWYLATCPEPTLQDAARAVTLAQKAVDRAPQRGSYWNTLGVARSA